MSLEHEVDDDIDIKILRVPLGPGMPFLDNDTCGERVILSGFFSLYDAIHVWMTRWMNGWKAS
jgi:hypothetical protein